MSNDNFLTSIEQAFEDPILSFLSHAFTIRNNQLKGAGALAPVIQGVAGAAGAIASGEVGSLVATGQTVPVPTGQISEGLAISALQALTANLTSAQAHTQAVTNIVAQAATPTKAVVPVVTPTAPKPSPTPVPPPTPAIPDPTTDTTQESDTTGLGVANLQSNF